MQEHLLSMAVVHWNLISTAGLLLLDPKLRIQPLSFWTFLSAGE